MRGSDSCSTARCRPVDELSKTIDELLDLTRADAGQLRLSTERLDLCRLVDEAVRQFGPRFAESGVRLEVQQEVRSAFCQGDAARLLMVLNNVLANALKYSPARRGRAGRGVQAKCRVAGRVGPASCRDGCRARHPRGVP